MVRRKRSSLVIWDMYYNGKLLKFDKETGWFRVKYEDGDIEDLERHELEEFILSQPKNGRGDTCMFPPR
ncbi:hypothetical protein KY290_030900 [Solanum tuberosum]|uniref:PTM/DIR17-like Tudor domain-containing protein n=1 Tax=Solanum tuberosum TaxID=4113 RepID=A0ABQ7U9F8_SOLTU|nr:hypothetical protein KY285_029980 [Solanum tuberosum]KAH0742907.1 hypothetical protein KY290_030900 [Solanum tuberosum]